jgi:alpha-amylase/alpha-mannosidase (GH57 family)
MAAYVSGACSCILDKEGRIDRIRNNYARISYNFGPTLLSWMQEHAPDTYAAILDADRVSAQRYGRGSAMAQAYNHMIMPLANDRDKRTQVRWGVRDFEHRFRRKPEGMWLPETAVDVASLEALAAEGIRFTILAPGQCQRVRELEPKDAPWREVGGAVDPSVPYLVRLPSGRTITVFFYDGPVSHDVAFQSLLSDGRKFLNRFTQAFPKDGRKGPAIAHIATDGETYGHHQRHGDMALAYTLRALRKEGHATVTNYASFLDKHPPRMEAQVRDNTSWSCAHGVERWRSDCGCSGGKPGWHQKWRAPLRQALDWLRDELAPHYEQEGRRLFKDPWAARDAYIDVVLDRSDEAVERFLQEHAAGPLDAQARVRALKLLEMQRHLMLMYTSCGWFFDEVTGIETVQVRAARCSSARKRWASSSRKASWSAWRRRPATCASMATPAARTRSGSSPPW